MGTPTDVYKLIRPSVAAEMLDVSEETLKRWREDGRGPRHVKIEGRVKYRLSDVQTYIDESSRASTNG